MFLNRGVKKTPHEGVGVMCFSPINFVVESSSNLESVDHGSFHVHCGFGFILQFKLEKGETFMLYISTIWSIGFGCQIESFSGEG
jgi:hypothetical protein